MSLSEKLAQAADVAAGVGSGSVTVSDGEIVIDNVVTKQDEKQSLKSIFDMLEEDPEQYELVGTVSKRISFTAKGDKTFGYSARFRPRESFHVSQETLDRWTEELMNFQFKPVSSPFGGTEVVLIADPQIGKKNTEQAIENWKRTVSANVERIRREIQAGIGPSAIHLAWQGDETEGVANNYTNQPHTVEMNMSDQLDKDFELRCWTIEQYAFLGLPISISSVISNHGEWTRNGSKDPVTTHGDNASTFIARLVKRHFDALEQYTDLHLDWTIGGGDPAVTLTLSGVHCYFSHGYLEKGRGASTEVRTKNAMERQILGRTEELGDVQIYFVAHYHHLYTNEFEGRTLFGCPALEAEKSSEYMLNSYGVWSPPGLLTVRVDSQYSRGYSGVRVYS